MIGTSKRNLYHVQDCDGDFYVLAASMKEAVMKSREQIVRDNPGEEDLLTWEPKGVTLIAESNEVLD